MRLDGLDIDVEPIPSAVPAWRGVVGPSDWRATCLRIAADGGRIVALWGSDGADPGRNGRMVEGAFVVRSGLVVLALPLATPEYPSVSDIFPAASRMQRATYDMLGLSAAGAGDTRKWLRHVAWPCDVFPLRRDVPGDGGPPASKHRADGPVGDRDDYTFVRVEGDGVHEIPVGPVHAGTIEPGHFRFSIVGERVLRLEQRLGYKHKGIEKRFEQMGMIEGARLAGRVSGDSTVAYAWAYAMAVESAAGVAPPPRAVWLRGLLLESERIANHLGDLGFLGNDAGLAFGLTQFSLLKENVLRLNRELFGHRYLMDTIVPGGVARDIDGAGMSRLRAQCDDLEKTTLLLKGIYDEHPGLQDRFMHCGRVAPELAAQLGLTGFAARASDQARDQRVQFPCMPYREIEVRMCTHRNGDVAARVTVRFDEIVESLRLIRLMLDRLPLGDVSIPVPVPAESARGVGWIEGWRGEVMVAFEAGRDGRIRRCHPHDPSWQNWPLLEHAVLGNIVPDFPLINKSFNLSYSGQDL